MPDAAPSPPLASQPPPILRLSLQTRQRIYRYLGLAPWDSTPHRFFLHAGQLKMRHGRDRLEVRFVPDPASFYGLLLSCRTIYAEAAALLYSTNQFILYNYFRPFDESHPPSSLRPLHTLHALTAPSLQRLSNLKIVLNEAACHQRTPLSYGIGCCLHGREESSSSRGLADCIEHHDGVHQRPLPTPATAGDSDDSLALAHAVASEWHAAARLLSRVAPGRLTLSLVCDIEPQHRQAIQLAKSIIAPLQQLPRGHLKELHIRLAKTKDRQLEQLARDAATHAFGIPAPPLPPPSKLNVTGRTLLTLPPELRLRILEHTDLVTPRRQVMWNRQDRAYSVLHFQWDLNYDPDKLYPSRFSDCWQNGGDWYSSHGCFCSRRHSAFSRRCKCWAPPGAALFLVCRALSQDARHVFFSSNRFIIHDRNPSPPWAVPILECDFDYPRNRPIPDYPYPHSRFAISEFLHHIVPASSLTHLRFLELVFPPYRAGTWPDTQHAAMQDWRDTVHWLRDKLNLSALVIRLCVADVHHGPRSYYRTITPAEAETVMAAYVDLMRPLRELAAGEGLAGFYAQLAYPWEHTEEMIQRCREDPLGDWVWVERDALKRRSEEFVMGERYGALYEGARQEPEPSDWELFHYMF